MSSNENLQACCLEFYTDVESVHVLSDVKNGVKEEKKTKEVITSRVNVAGPATIFSSSTVADTPTSDVVHLRWQLAGFGCINYVGSFTERDYNATLMGAPPPPISP